MILSTTIYIHRYALGYEADGLASRPHFCSVWTAALTCTMSVNICLMSSSAVLSGSSRVSVPGCWMGRAGEEVESTRRPGSHRRVPPGGCCRANGSHRSYGGHTGEPRPAAAVGQMGHIRVTNRSEVTMRSHRRAPLGGFCRANGSHTGHTGHMVVTPASPAPRLLPGKRVTYRSQRSQ